MRDANASTFYSALSNVDFAVGDGKSAAGGVRMHTAGSFFSAGMLIALDVALYRKPPERKKAADNGRPWHYSLNGTA